MSETAAELRKHVEALKLAILNEFAWILRPTVKFLARLLKADTSAED